MDFRCEFIVSGSDITDVRILCVHTVELFSFLCYIAMQTEQWYFHEYFGFHSKKQKKLILHLLFQDKPSELVPDSSNKSLINCYVIFIFWDTHIPRPRAE